MKKRWAILLLPLLLLFFFCTSVSADLLSVSGTYDYSAAHLMLDLVNAERAANGLPALSYDYNLEFFATQRAAELSVVNSHLRPDGSATPYYENYSIGWPSAEQAIASFMASASHRSNILSPNFTSMAGAVFSDGSQWYWVQIFSAGTDPGVANGMAGLVSDSRSVDTGTQVLPDTSDYDDSLQLEVGNYIIVKGSSNGEMLSASWSSDDPYVASVDSSGKVTGRAAGTAVITADFGVQVKRILVTVVGAAAAPAPAPPPIPEVTEPPVTETPIEEPIYTEIPTESSELAGNDVVVTESVNVEENTSVPITESETAQTSETTGALRENVSTTTMTSPVTSEESQEKTTGLESASGESTSGHNRPAIQPLLAAGTENDTSRKNMPSGTASMRVADEDNKGLKLFLLISLLSVSSITLLFSLMKDLRRVQTRRRVLR